MKFFYIRNANGLPVATVASELADGQVRFAVAAYNPKDVFDKNKGRQIAEGRLKAGKYFARFTMPTDKTVKKMILGIVGVYHPSNTTRLAAREMFANKYMVPLPETKLVN